MRIGSLFSGIGGLDLGIEAATGGSVAWQCEADPYCRTVLARHWPGVTCFRDVVGLEPPPVDILIGGFPCQDISQAGKKEGIHGKKSGLWGEFARIIRKIRPRFVFVENVRALTQRGLDRVLGDLAACGYDAVWDCLGACCVGAPHRRERLFVLAYPQSAVPDACGLPLPISGDHGQGEAMADPDGGGCGFEREQEPGRVEGSRRGQPDGRGDTRGQHNPAEVSDAHHAGRGKQRGDQPTGAEYPTPECAIRWTSEPNVGRVVDGFSTHLDGGGAGRNVRLRALGNAVVPAQAETAFRLLASRVFGKLQTCPSP